MKSSWIVSVVVQQGPRALAGSQVAPALLEGEVADREGMARQGAQHGARARVVDAHAVIQATGREHGSSGRPLRRERGRVELHLEHQGAAGQVPDAHELVERRRQDARAVRGHVDVLDRCAVRGERAQLRTRARLEDAQQVVAGLRHRARHQVLAVGAERDVARQRQVRELEQLRPALGIDHEHRLPGGADGHALAGGVDVGVEEGLAPGRRTTPARGSRSSSRPRARAAATPSRAGPPGTGPGAGASRPPRRSPGWRRRPPGWRSSPRRAPRAPARARARSPRAGARRPRRAPCCSPRAARAPPTGPGSCASGPRWRATAPGPPLPGRA